MLSPLKNAARSEPSPPATPLVDRPHQPRHWLFSMEEKNIGVEKMEFKLTCLEIAEPKLYETLRHFCLYLNHYQSYSNRILPIE